MNMTPSPCEKRYISIVNKFAYEAHDIHRDYRPTSRLVSAYDFYLPIVVMDRL